MRLHKKQKSLTRKYDVGFVFSCQKVKRLTFSEGMIK